MAKKASKKAQSASQALITASQLPPVLSTPASTKLMPPPARPQNAPVHQLQGPNHSDAGSSARKKRRRRARKSGQGGDSFSEGTSVQSNNTTSNTETSINTNGKNMSKSKAQVSGWAHVSGSSAPVSRTESTPATRRSLFRDALPEESRSDFDKNPEEFDFYDSSTDDEAGDEVHNSVSNTANLAQTAEPSLSKSNAHENESRDLPDLQTNELQTSQLLEFRTSRAEKDILDNLESRSSAAIQSLKPKTRTFPKKKSGTRPTPISMHEPLQLTNGRFACPYSKAEGCKTTYAHAKDARKHGESHVEPNKFRCEECGKDLRRRDKLLKHMMEHDLSRTNANAETSTEIHSAPQKEVHAVGHSTGVLGNGDQIMPEGLYELMDLDVEVTDAEPEPPSDEEAREENPEPSQLQSNDVVTIQSAVKTRERARESKTAAADQATSDDAPQKSQKSSANPSAVTFSSARKRKRSPSELAPVVNNSRKRIRRDKPNASGFDQAIDRQPQAHITGNLPSVEQQSDDNMTNEPIDENQTLAGGEHVDSSGDVSNQSSHEKPSNDASTPGPSTGEISRRARARKTSIPVRSKLVPQLEKRQSSLDGFVERPSSDLGSFKSSTNSKRIVISVPPPPILGTQRSASRSDPASISVKNRVSTRKGKERAVSSDEQDSEADLDHPTYEEEEATSSDDRPKATTVARRTSSLTSKKSGMSKKRKKPDSDDEDSKHSSDSATARLKRKNRPPNREASFKELAKMGEIGRFRDKEIRILYEWRDRFCAEHNISTTEFNDMMTATLRKKIIWKADISKNEFLQEYYNQLPNRNRRAMLRFRERYFQNLEDHKWTEKDDQDLKDLVSQLGQKWVEIGQMMGRSQDFVTQRWIHRLNRGKERNLGPWTEDEEKGLFQEVEAVAKASGKSPSSKDLIIPWAAISEKLKTNRTAQQCSNKWRNETTKKVGESYVEVPLNDRIPSSGSKAPRTPSKMARRLAGSSRTPASRTSSTKTYKSAERVEDSEEADDEHDKVDQQDDHSEDEDKESGSEIEQSDAVSPSDKEQAVAEDSEKSEDDIQVERGGTGDSTGVVNQEDDEVDLDASRPNMPFETTEVRRYIPSPSPPPRISQSEKFGSPIAKIPRSTRLGSPKSPNGTSAVSKNPFAKSRIPDDGPSLSQVFAGTVASSSANKSPSGRSATSRNESHVVPDRPSPSNSVRKYVLSSPKSLPSPLNVKGPVPEHMDVDDIKSPNSFVSAREDDVSSMQGDDANSTENEEDSNEERSVSDTESAPKSAVSAKEEEEEEADSEADSESPAPDSQATSRGFWGSIANILGASQKASEPGMRKRRALDAVMGKSANNIQSDDDNDDDDDENE